jgi:hypothetical protein
MLKLCGGPFGKKIPMSDFKLTCDCKLTWFGNGILFTWVQVWCEMAWVPARHFLLAEETGILLDMIVLTIYSPHYILWSRKEQVIKVVHIDATLFYENFS